MSALVRRIREIIMRDRANKGAELKSALEELGIDAGAENPVAFKQLQQILLNSGRDSEVLLRRALNGIGVTGGGPGAGEVRRIRQALLRDGRVDNLRSAINDLIDEIGGVPDGALAHADFINGIYFDGVATTANAMIDEPSLITAEGLSWVEGSQEVIANAIGDFADILFSANWRIDIEAKIASGPMIDGQSVGFIGLGVGEGATDVVDCGVYHATFPRSFISDFIDDGDPIRFAEVNATGVNDGTAHTFSYVRTDASISSQLDEGVSVADDSSSFSMPSMNEAKLLWTNSFQESDLTFHIRKLTVYPP